MQKTRLMKLLCAMCCVLLACALTACGSSSGILPSESADADTTGVEEYSPADIVDSGPCGRDVVWTLDENGVLTISGTGRMQDYDGNSYSYAPWYEHNSLNAVISVVIEDGVTSIGDSAFRTGHGLTSITISNSVVSIGEEAFYNCTALASVTIPDSVTSIGYRAFDGCTSLTSITIGNGVTDINIEAFKDCTSLTSVVIPDSVTNIGRRAFDGCTGLTGVTIGNGVTSIGERAFYECTSLTDVYYTGSESEWASIDIDSDNECLTDAVSFG